MGNKMLRLCGALLGLASYPLNALADYQLNLQLPQTALGREIYDLHTIITLICVVIFIGVFGFMFYAVFKHRKSVGHKAAQFHENTAVEVAWTLIPCVILIVMAVPATHRLIEMHDTSQPDLTIKATGYQWKWGYDYLRGEGEGIAFYSTLSTPRDQIEGRAPKGPNYLLETDNHVMVPVGKKVRVLVTAQDVIHAWWVPQLAVKQDAIPGFIRDTWFKADKPGLYRGQCAELCGKEHGFMPIVVEVVEAAKYTAWVNAQKEKLKKVAVAEAPGKAWTLDDLKAHGAKVYGQHCVACHQPGGTGTPPVFPALSGSKVVNGPKVGQIEVVLNGVVKDGKPTAMAPFKQQLSDTDIAAVITYTRNSWSNKTGEAVLPDEVKALRK